jgi:hypothetical protein
MWENLNQQVWPAQKLSCLLIYLSLVLGMESIITSRCSITQLHTQPSTLDSALTSASSNIIYTASWHLSRNEHYVDSTVFAQGAPTSSLNEVGHLLPLVFSTFHILTHLYHAPVFLSMSPQSLSCRGPGNGHLQVVSIMTSCDWTLHQCPQQEWMCSKGNLVLEMLSPPWLPRLTNSYYLLQI